MDQLKGLKIAHVYEDDDDGRETIPLLDAQAARYGFAVQHLPVQMPGLDQKATWLRVKVYQPAWVILRTGGVMTTTALKEAAQVGVPRDKIVGPFPTCTEQHVVPAGEAAIGLICTNWYGWGTHFPLIQEIFQSVYARGKGAGPEQDVGTASWMRGMLRALLTTEALRTAMRAFGNQPLTGAQVQWGLEHLSLTAARLKEMGAESLLAPFSLSCRDHEGGGGVKFHQWDGKQWHAITDWIAAGSGVGAAAGGGVSGKVCAREGNHAAGLPLGARLLSQGAHGAVLPTRAAPNQALHLTASSVRCAPASGSR
jgi:branched-chain amino acid transport system substrate-binding protein